MHRPSPDAPLGAAPLATAAHRSTIFRRTRRRGEMSPLIALALAGGIAAIIAVGVAAYGDDTRNDAKVDAYYQQIVHVMNAMQSRYGSDYSRFGAIVGSPQRLASLKMVPASQVSGGLAVNPYGGMLAVSADWSQTMYGIVLRDTSVTPTVPIDACVALVGRLAGLPNILGFYSTSNLGGVGHSPTIAQATAICSDTATQVNVL